MSKPRQRAPRARSARGGSQKYDQALALDPNSAEALCNRGIVLQRLRRFEAALASYDAALVSRPDWAEVLSNRGNTLQQLQRPQDALASYGRALALRPNFAEALYNRGMTFLSLNCHEMAIRDFEQALRIDPQFKALRGLLVHSKMQCCDWRSLADEWRLLADEVQARTGATRPFALLGLRLPHAISCGVPGRGSATNAPDRRPRSLEVSDMPMTRSGSATCPAISVSTRWPI